MGWRPQIWSFFLFYVKKMVIQTLSEYFKEYPKDRVVNSKLTLKKKDILFCLKLPYCKIYSLVLVLHNRNTMTMLFFPTEYRHPHMRTQVFPHTHTFLDSLSDTCSQEVFCMFFSFPILLFSWQVQEMTCLMRKKFCKCLSSFPETDLLQAQSSNNFILSLISATRQALNFPGNKAIQPEIILEKYKFVLFS